MQISQIVQAIEQAAPLSLQESFDNAGIQVGDVTAITTGALLCVDVTEAVLNEAISLHVNLIISHHPLLFKGLKSITGKSSVERIVMRAITHGITIYAAHTNLDSAVSGVNYYLANLLGLKSVLPLAPATETLLKLTLYVPVSHAESVRNALFVAGAGSLGDYAECSFNSNGVGTFLPGADSHPYVGEKGKRHFETETCIEVLLPATLEHSVENALLLAHPYEMPAYDFSVVHNGYSSGAGLGVVGELPEPLTDTALIEKMKALLNAPVARHSPCNGRLVHRVAICGGSGASLLSHVKRVGAEAFLTGELKYHDYFEASPTLLLADFGHYETEACTKAIFCEIIQKKFPNFALHYTKAEQNPINYL